jgi:hypothetical protein
VVVATISTSVAVNIEETVVNAIIAVLVLVVETVVTTGEELYIVL